MLIPTPPRPGQRRLSREQERRAQDALVDLAEAPDASDVDLTPWPERILGRITAIQAVTSGAALYSWEYASPAADGLTVRDRSGFAGDPTYLPAWEITGNCRVPVDGSAVVELFPSAGGLYWWFQWPERYTPAQITGNAGAPHAWQELAPGVGGAYSPMSGGRTGTTTVNPAYEINGATAVPTDTVVWLERGYGAPPDVVASITTHGNGTTIHQVQHVVLSNAVGGTWTLGVVDSAGNGQVTAAILFNANAAAVQAAIRALTGFGATTVTGSGTSGSPFVVTMLDTFADLPLMLGDPFRLTGVQEWFFEHPAAAGVKCNVTVFTASGTWTKPANLLFVEVEVVGGGGGGGGANSDAPSHASGGGGGGGYCRVKIDAAGLGATEAVTVGAGGAHGSGSGGGSGPGSAGGTSTFGAAPLARATGGGGGEYTAANTAIWPASPSGLFTAHAFGGGGGVGSLGDVNCQGGPGEDGWGLGFTSSGIVVRTLYGGGNGGDSVLGGGGKSAVGSGAAGGNYGGGGSGATSTIATQIDGSDGAAGVVIVREYTT